jgi:hypothetical protein
MKQAPPPSSPDDSGTIDVRRALWASSSRPLPLSELAREGRRTVSLLSKARIYELINRAVRDLVEAHRAQARKRPGPPPPPDEPSFYQRLQELLREVEGTNQAREALEASRLSLLEELQDLRTELAREKARASEKREDALDRSPFLGVADFDRQIGAIVTQACLRQLPPEGAEKPAGFQKEWDRLEALLRERVLQVVREERGRIRPAPAGSNKPLWMLERRIDKLYSELDALQRAITIISTSKVQNNQLLQTALRELGLVIDDKYHEKKKEMLKVVLDNNREIRQRHRELSARGITLSSPRPPV